MIGRFASYLAAVTALTVVSFTFLPTRCAGRRGSARRLAYDKRRFARPRAHEAAAE
jgi:hypothetical protein